MLDLIGAGASYIFPGVRAIKLVRDGINVTNSTNPLILTKNITLIVVDCCAPLPVRLVAHCVGAGSLIAVSIMSPNPVTIGSAIHLVTEIYENC